ncbi:MAG: hypothetical protein ABJK59_02035 [Erythrobacter sp.]|uniref:hypothetical protein n=1 Tax=Erythrobacter sp. TaxID=1042 RepID=UPI00329A3345
MTHSALITLGSPKYPFFRALEQNSFQITSDDLRTLFTSGEEAAIKSDFVLPLFGSELAASKQLIEIRDFLRKASEEGSDSRIDNIIIHYVGHGSFRTNSNDYFLTIRETDEDLEYDTSLSVASIHRLVSKYSRKFRFYFIVDACFSGSISKSIQSSEHGAKLATQINQILDEGDPTADGPKSGVAFLCSSESFEFSEGAGPDGRTQFGGALISALENGDSRYGARLTLSDILSLTIEVLRERHDDPILPLISSNEKDGSLADIPLFPNLAPPDIDPRLAILTDDQKTKLSEKAEQFVSDLLSASRKEAFQKAEQIDRMGQEQIRAAKIERRFGSGDMKTIVPELKKLLKELEAVARNADPSSYSGKRILGLIPLPKNYRFKRSLDESKYLLSAFSSELLKSHRQEIILWHAGENVERARFEEAYGKLAQMLYVSSGLKGKFSEALVAADQRDTRSVLKSAIEKVAVRHTELVKATKSLGTEIDEVERTLDLGMRLANEIEKIARQLDLASAQLVDPLAGLVELAKEKKTSTRNMDQIALFLEELTACVDTASFLIESLLRSEPAV